MKTTYQCFPEKTKILFNKPKVISSTLTEEKYKCDLKNKVNSIYKSNTINAIHLVLKIAFVFLFC